MKIWIVTNYGGGENYTPSVFKSEKEAREWMQELTTSLKNDSDYDVEITNNKAIVGEPDDGGNIVQLFEMEL